MSKQKSISSFFAAPSSSSTAASDESSNPTKRQKVSEGGEVALPLSSSSSPSQWRGVFESLEPSWKERMKGEFSKPYVARLVEFLDQESRSHIVFPPRESVWSAFNLCPFDKVRVVIIGQDPYHGPGQAHGLAFSVAKGVQVPPSLRNMIIEASRDPAVATPERSPHGNLECWSRQGVLLLNTCLTVRKSEANSHQKRGWEQFTDAVVRELGQREGIVYLLWGAPAQAKCKDINAKKNTIIKSSHPSPLGAYKTEQPFMGSKCFSRCNTALEQMQQPPIDWNIT